MEPMLMWGLGLLVAALLVLVLELFVPSAGVLAVTSAALAVAGIVCLFVHDKMWGISGMLVTLILTPIIVGFGLRLMPHTPMGKRMLFGEDGEERPVLPEAVTTEYDKLLGKSGEAVTDLRPVGTVKIEGERHEALAETHYVRAGAKVRVVDVEGTQIKVRPLT